MKVQGRFLAVLMLSLLSCLAAKETGANVCVYKPVKVRYVQGIIIDFANEPLSNAKLRLWESSERKILVAEGVSEEAGRFRLGRLAPAHYYLEIQAYGFSNFEGEIIVSRMSSVKRGLEFTAFVGMTACGSILRARDLKPFERLPSPLNGKENSTAAKN